ncbi:probable chitinase 2 isoform X1 [Episyrphus balteatus]|uniref:probable chitinase 2 isoform X1 n=2 Tax=Episyrphus balteatus TaxID=286459 RepID=UPI0024853CE5|nr:probable chitinase 2 isoform X1 [Episyrphus balteatus]
MFQIEVMMISLSAATVRWPLMVLVGALACIALTLAKTGPTHDKVVVCYLSTWAVYRPGKGSYAIENFDANLCTHVVYAFVGLDITQNAIRSLDPWQDLKDNYGKAGFDRINALKKTHPHLKVTLAIGGWNEGSKNYSIMAGDPIRRQAFVQQASNFIRKYNFDGLDLDWEYPTQRGGDPKDRESFVLLAKDLHNNFRKHNLLLTTAIGASKTVIDEAYDIKELSKYLDFLHIMCYDYHGSWDRKIGPNAPLEDDGFLSVRFTIEYLMQLGCPASKLVVGLPFYGRTFKTALDGYIGDESDDSGFQGPFTREDGFLGYNEICPLLSNKTSGWTKLWDNKTSQAIARLHEEGGVTKVVTYDSTRSIANKVRFAVQKNLAGAMVWSVDTDDFLGECEPESDTFAEFGNIKGVKLQIPRRINTNYPLLRTINEGIVLAIEEIDQQNAIDNERNHHIEHNEIPHGSVDDHKGKHSGALSVASIAVSTILVTYSFVSFIC